MAGSLTIKLDWQEQLRVRDVAVDHDQRLQGQGKQANDTFDIQGRRTLREFLKILVQVPAKRTEESISVAICRRKSDEWEKLRKGTPKELKKWFPRGLNQFLQFNDTQVVVDLQVFDEISVLCNTTSNAENYHRLQSEAQTEILLDAIDSAAASETNRLAQLREQFISLAFNAAQAPDPPSTGDGENQDGDIDLADSWFPRKWGGVQPRDNQHIDWETRQTGEGEASTSGEEIRLVGTLKEKLTDEQLDSALRRLKYAKELSAIAYLAPLQEAGCSDDGRLYFVETYSDGKRLDDWARENHNRIKIEGKKYSQVCSAIAAKIAQAILQLHDQGLVHLNLSPRNVVIAEDLSPTVTGAALGAVLSTLPYPIPHGSLETAFRAPEQLEGRYAGEAADVYSLGALLYFLLDAAPPFQDESPKELRELIKKVEARPIKPRPNIDDRVVEVCRWCMRKEPFVRPPIEEVALQLEILARDSTPLSRSGRDHGQNSSDRFRYDVYLSGWQVPDYDDLLDMLENKLNLNAPELVDDPRDKKVRLRCQQAVRESRVIIAPCSQSLLKQGWTEQQIAWRRDEETMDQDTRQTKTKIVLLMLEDVELPESLQEWDVVHWHRLDPRQRQERLAQAVNRRWWVPYPDNREQFVESVRTHEIHDLDNALDKHHVALLHGSSGMGKTELAVYYAYAFQEKYQGNVLWVTSGEDCVSALDLDEIGRRAPEHYNIISTKNSEPSQVVRSLARYGNRLIVLDDVRDLEFLKAVLRKREKPNAHVLITLHSSVCDGELSLRQLPGEARIFVDQLDEQQSLELVARKSGHRHVLEDPGFDEARRREVKAAREIMRAVGGCPLYLQHIAEFLSKPGASFSEWAPRFTDDPVASLQIIAAKKPNDRLHKENSPSGQEGQISFLDFVQSQFQQLCKVDRVAANILRLTCFLHPEQIPDELFSQAARIRDMGIGDQGVSPHLQRLPANLIRHEASERMFRINHKMTQQELRTVLREEGEEEYRRWAGLCIEVLNEAFPIPSFERWATCQRLARHVESAIELTVDKGLNVDSVALGELLWKFGDFLANRHANLKQWEHRLNQAAQVLSRAGPQSAVRLYVLMSQCQCARELEDADMMGGAAEEGVALGRELMGVLDASHDKEEMDRFISQLWLHSRPQDKDDDSQNDRQTDRQRAHFYLRYLSLRFTSALASSFQKRHEHEKSNELNAEIEHTRRMLFKEWRQELPQDFDDTDKEELHIDNAVLLDPSDKDDCKTVKGLIGEVLSIRLHSRKHDRPSFANRLMELGRMALDFNHVTLADAAFTQAARMRTRVFHAKHDYVGSALQGVAHVRLKAGHPTRALAIMEQAVKIFSEVFSSAHGQVAYANLDVGWILAKSGKLAEGFERVKFVREYSPSEAWAPRIIRKLLRFAWLYHQHDQPGDVNRFIEWAKRLCQQGKDEKSVEYVETLYCEGKIRLAASKTQGMAILQEARDTVGDLIVKKGFDYQRESLRRDLDHELMRLDREAADAGIVYQPTYRQY